jgi:CDP-diacylglycerol--glycerol-3-phosphate 3-phosphatidyltransferase
MRRLRGEPVGDLPESRVRRPLAALQMVFITAALLPITPADLVWPAATLVMLPSLAVFLRDYLAVTRGFRKAKAKDISEPS